MRILFDLDGTLIDSSCGVIGCIQRVLHEFQHPIPSNDQIKKMMGPPMLESFQTQIGMNKQRSYQAITRYRELYDSTGFMDAKVYPDIVEVLSTLKDKGHHLAVATLKHQKSAENVLSYFKLKQYFDCVVGVKEDEKVCKGDIIKQALQSLNVVETNDKKRVKHVLQDTALMVGDSKYDFIGAKENGIPFCAALYGIGFNTDPVNLDVFRFVAYKPTDIIGFV